MKRIRTTFSTFAIGALMTVGIIAVSSASAVAAPIVTQIGPTCGTCQGGIYTLSVDFVSSGATNSIYDVSLTVDTSTGPYTGGGTYITSAALKISSSIVSATQTGAPSSFGYVGTAFATQSGGLSSSGCSGSGGGFFCSGIPNDGSKGYGALVSSGTNTWSWQVTIGNGKLFTDLDGSSVKVRYAKWDSSGQILTKVGDLVSDDFGPGTMVPEPTTYLLTGLGLLGLGLVRRYRKSA